MRIRSVLHRLDGNWWLAVGLLFYVGAALSSIVRSLEPMSALAFLDMSIDWFAACVIYFFLGALLGHLVDWRLSRNKRVSHPVWFWVTAAMWLFGSLALAIFVKPGVLPWAYIVFFPWLFGVFFVGAAFYKLVPGFVQSFLYAKTLLDILYLGVFGSWLWLERKGLQKTVRRVLLGVLLVVLVVGLVSCVQSLAQTPAPVVP